MNNLPITGDEDRSWVLIANAPRAAAEGGWVAVSFLEFGDTHPELGFLPLVLPLKRTLRIEHTRRKRC